jgi:CRISPR-associated protein Cas1
MLARNFCLGKIFNSRNVLQRLLRDHRDKVNQNEIENAILSLAGSLRKISDSSKIQELLGIEGDAAKIYYGVFNELIVNKTSGFVFNGRSRRPPLDEVNALLSFFYVLLSHEVEAALESVGLDPQMGFYHQIRAGRASLALDLMEELRAYIVDRFVVSLINNNMIDKSDFFRKENEAILLKDEARAKLLQHWQHRKKDMIVHPYLKEKIEIGLIPYTQSLLLARYIRGDIDEYPPFLMR